MLVDHHPGYISWEEYLENRRRLEANVAWSESEGSGAAKLGAALAIRLAALWSMRHGKCKLFIAAAAAESLDTSVRVIGETADPGHCFTVGSLRLDRAVVQSVLTAIQPAGIEAAVKLAECAKVEDDEKRKALELALERARYEEKRARRQFDAVEPENRLVASELEARWNGALASGCRSRGTSRSGGENCRASQRGTEAATVHAERRSVCAVESARSTNTAEEAHPADGLDRDHRRQ